MRAHNRPCAHAADGERVEFIARRSGRGLPLSGTALQKSADRLNASRLSELVRMTSDKARNPRSR